MNVANAIKPATTQGRKYGCTRKNCRCPKVSGHRVAGLARMPPIMGLENSTWVCMAKDNYGATYAIVEPMLHIKGIKA